jgi:hypothetical protein
MASPHTPEIAVFTGSYWSYLASAESYQAFANLEDQTMTDAELPEDLQAFVIHLIDQLEGATGPTKKVDPRKSITAALEHITQNSTLNKTVCFSMAQVWCEFLGDPSEPRKINALNELEKDWGAKPYSSDAATYFFESLQKRMTDDERENRKVLGNAALLMMCKEKFPEKTIAQSLKIFIASADRIERDERSR